MKRTHLTPRTLQRHTSWLVRAFPAWLAAVGLLSLVSAARPAEAGNTVAAGDAIAALTRIVNEYRAQLALTHEVRVAIVNTNPLLVSVERSTDGRPGYVLSFDERFLPTLSEEELRAALAHELGHVWIFTHHPYLQTEQLANRIALRLVTRESLVSVYEKVWRHGGKKGDLSRFLED